MRLKISARKSDLARLQAYMVGDALKDAHPGLEIEYKFKESLGDKNLTDPLWKMPEKGVFTEDFHAELIRGETDLVVHSWKDLPTEVKTDTAIVATMPRADQRDLLLIKKSHFERIRSAKALRVFSSSPRREYNLTPFFKTHLPFGLQSVSFESVRGNIPTRIRKLLENDDVNGLIVAKAALDRLLSAPAEEFREVQALLKSYLDQLEWAALPLSINPNAAAQGALAVEILATRSDLRELLTPIHDQETYECAIKERALLASFGGGCHQKIGVAVLARPYGELTVLRGLTDDGRVLETRRLDLKNEPPKFPADALWSGEMKAERTRHSIVTVDASLNAFYVARAEAWTDGIEESGYIWTAGTKTWKNLAQDGIWVHGCSESLGEQEDPRIDILAGKPLKWAKLSHDEGFDNKDSTFDLVSTYSLKVLSGEQSFAGKECFFWNSGTQFLHAVKEDASILNKHHACGPGNTSKVIRAYLEKNNAFDPNRLHVFLDQEDWRHQCTI